MKKLHKILAASLASVALVGCNDLDTEPMSNFVTQTQKEEVLEVNPGMVAAGVQGITTMFQLYMNVYSSAHCDFGYPAMMLFGDSRGADLVSHAIGYNWFSGSVTYDDLVSTNRFSTIAWCTMYNQIKTANTVVGSMDPSTEDPTACFYLAQAYAIRAFDYHYLVQLFAKTYKGNESSAGVPLITPENSDVAATDGLARSSVEEVYKLILSDCDIAIQLLERAESPFSGREAKRYVDLATAYGLRARVNLVMNNWAAAAADAQAAIENSSCRPYTMDEVNHPTFVDATEPSWMWSILVEEQDRVVTSGLVNFPSHMGSLNYGYASVGAWRYGNEEMVNSLPTSDVRKGWWLNENGTSPNLSAAQQAYCNAYIGEGYVQVKFGPYGDELGTSTNACDIPLMRIEEMYLIKAEAQAMAGSAVEGAATLTAFVKANRDPNFNCLAASAADVQESVYQQRRVELWGEGFSYFDILRLKKPVNRVGAGFEKAYTYNIPADDPCLIMQIPNVEEQANKLLGTNNPVGSKPTPVN